MAFTSERDGNPEIYVVNLPDGDVRRLTANSAVDWLPDRAPDGQRLAFTSDRSGGYDLWVMRADGSEQTSVVATGAWDDYPRWAPDGQRLALVSTGITAGVPNAEIFVRLADGNLAQRTATTLEDQWPDWSPDGRIAYCEGTKGTSNWDIYIMNGDGSNASPWLGGGTCDVKPTWSPDGRWIAFARVPRDSNGNGQIDEEDAGDVWVGRVDGSGLRQLTSGAWVATLAWSPDSQWIAFAWLRDTNGNARSDSDDTSDIWAVPVGGGDPVLLVEDAGDPTWTR
jgi:Tol biopolymer transport system component